MSRDLTRDRAGEQLGLGRLHAHICRIITCLSESISIELDPPYPSGDESGLNLRQHRHHTLGYKRN